VHTLAHRNLTLIGIAAICLAFLQNGVNTVSPLVASIIADFSAEDPTVVIMVQTIPALGMVVGSLLYGVLSRVTSSRVVLLLACGIYTASSVVPLFLGQMLLPLLVVRFFMGLGAGICAAMAVALIAANFDEQRSARFMGYIVAAQSAAMIFFLVGAGFLGASNWRHALLLGLVCLPVLVYGLIVLPREDKQGRQEASKRLVARKLQIKALPFFEKYPAYFWTQCILIFLYFAGIFVFLVNTSIMIEASGYGGTWEAVLVINIQTGTSLLLSFAFGRLYARVGTHLLFIAALAAAAGFGCIYLAQNLIWMCAGAALLGFSIPNFLATLYQLVGKHAHPLVSASSTSVLLAFQQMGGVLMVSFVKPLCEVLGLDFSVGRDPFLVYVAVFVLIALVALWQVKGKQQSGAH